MTSPGGAIVRYAGGLLLSIGLNLGLIVSLAELGRPYIEEDKHEPHQVAPSVVQPPPVPEPVRSSASPPSPTPLPSAPSAPMLDVPAPSLDLDGPGLAWTGLNNIGLGRFDLPSTDAPAETPSYAPDVQPQLSFPPDLARFYPSEARRRKIGGRTILAIQVNAKGQVTEARVLRSEPPGLFERAAQRAARHFRFEPALRQGRAVAAETRLELKWQPRS
ncbi:MAG: energy transducer TonB [Myxococcota bacterium]